MNSRHSTNRLLAFVILMILCSQAAADTISFRADSMSGNTGSGQEATVLSGRAWISTGDMEINADKIELTGSCYDIITATGNVSGTDTGSELTFSSGRLIYDRRTDIIRLEEDVRLIDTENDVNAQAYLIEYNKKTETAVLQLNVKLVKKESVCTSALATWRKSEKLLEMSGSPKIVQNDDVFTAQEITFNLDTEEITLDGKVRGTVTDTDDSSETGEESE